jgi:2-polyprenyl-3-methyl-5-hydroxy-6-metoxy-1,4-benzoquinol methylase
MDQSPVSDAKQAINATAWHADVPYQAKEEIRMARACAVMREHAKGLPPDRRCQTLDIGCGIGPLRKWLDAERFRIVGLEISEEAAALARKNYDACEVVDCEAPWPFAPGSFDFIHAGAILEHVYDWHTPLNQANRVLSDDGLLLVSVPNLCYWKGLRRMLQFKQPHWLVSMKHVHGYTIRFLRQLVELHGFEVISVEADRVNLPLLPNWPWVLRRFAAIGSVLILWARVGRRVRIEDKCYSAKFPNCKPIGPDAIEVPLED